VPGFSSCFHKISDCRPLNLRLPLSLSLFQQFPRLRVKSVHSFRLIQNSFFERRSQRRLFRRRSSAQGPPGDEFLQSCKEVYLLPPLVLEVGINVFLLVSRQLAMDFFGQPDLFPQGPVALRKRISIDPSPVCLSLSPLSNLDGPSRNIFQGRDRRFPTSFDSFIWASHCRCGIAGLSLLTTIPEAY